MSHPAPAGEPPVGLWDAASAHSPDDAEILNRLAISDGAQSRGGDGVFLFALIVSISLHAALLAFLLGTATQSTVGSGGQELDAIGIEIVSASALETISTDRTSLSGGATAPIEVSPGAPSAVEQAAIAPQVMTASTEPTKEQPEALLKPDHVPSVDADIAAAETVKDDPKPVEETPVVVAKPNQEPGHDNQQRAAQEAIVSGGESTRGAQVTATEGAAGASPGELARFAIEVRLALGRYRPRHDGKQGRVQLSFGLTETGEVRFVDVVKSSGSDRLDGAAVTAVRSAKFPAPPVGMIESQRTYVVPFDFK